MIIRVVQIDYPSMRCSACSLFIVPAKLLAHGGQHEIGKYENARVCSDQSQNGEAANICAATQGEAANCKDPTFEVFVKRSLDIGGRRIG